MELNAITTTRLEFTYHLGQERRRIVKPAGTEVLVNSGEMEDNPNFFPVTIPGTLGHFAYVSLADITPA